MALIRALKNLFVTDSTAPAEDQDRQLKLAAAGLMLEVSKADFDESEQEQQRISDLLTQSFNLSSQELTSIQNTSREESEHSNDLHPLTRVINAHYDVDAKFELVKKLWQVALADDVVDKYEEALIRKIADLIYLPHSRFIQAKLQVQEQR